jgi:nucleoside-diphosphate-sugar epimerase
VSPARRFEGRTVAVTGAGGFIGGGVAAALARKGARVVGLDVAPAALARIEALGAQPVLADVTDRDALAEALGGCELVVHTAALVHEWGEMREFTRVNVGGTRNVLAAAGARRVVHVSSVVVYGYDDPSEQGEDAPRRACGIPYIDTKSASDRLACECGAVVVRPGDVYGPGGTQWVVRLAELARARRLALPTSGVGVMLPVFVDDLVEAILLALERGEAGRAYTAWDGSPVGFDEYFTRIARIAGGELRRVPRPALELSAALAEAWARARGRPPPFTRRSLTFVERRGTASTARARAELGWEPRVTLDEGLRRVEAWLRAG